MGWTALDLETGIKAAGGRKGSPFCLDNDIIAAGWLRQGGPVEGMYSKDGLDVGEWFENLLEGTKLLVGQNIKFDLLYILTRSERAYKAWMRHVEAGLNVWDTQLAEYLLQGQRQSAHMLSMDEMVVWYGGNTKVDEVKEFWNAGVE